MVKVSAWSWSLLVNGLLAFSLNLYQNIYIKRSSVVTVAMAARFKDMSIIASGFIFFHESFSGLQWAAGSMLLALAFVWSWVSMKSKQEQTSPADEEEQCKPAKRDFCDYGAMAQYALDLKWPCCERLLAGESQRLC